MSKSKEVVLVYSSGVVQIWPATAARRTPIPFIIHTQDKLRPDENNDDHDEDERESLERTELVPRRFHLSDVQYILYAKLPRMRKETLKFTFFQKLAVRLLFRNANAKPAMCFASIKMHC